MFHPRFIIQLSISWATLVLAASCAGPVLGQSMNGILPKTEQPVYVQVPASGFIATHVQTKRTMQGKTQLVDIVNIFADSSFFLRHNIVESGQTLDGPFYGDKLLITMVLLPDKATGLVKWEPIATDAYAKLPQVPLGNVLQDCYVRLFAYRAAQPYGHNLTRRLDLRPVVMRDGKPWTTQNTVLTEYFLVRNQPLWFPTGTDNVTINCQARPFTRADFAKLEQRLVAAFPQITTRPILAGELVTKLLLEKREGSTYTFWSIPPHVSDAEIDQFGAVELQFRPSIGVVSGKYSEYFGLGGDNGFNTFFEVLGITSLSVK